MDTFSNTVQNTLTHKTFSTSKGRHLLPQVLSAMQSFWQLIYRPVNCCMISSERPPTHGSIQVVPRTVSLWFHHTRPVQVGQRRGLMVVAEAWRTAVPSHWCGSPASCCHCVSRLRLTRGITLCDRADPCLDYEKPKLLHGSTHSSIKTCDQCSKNFRWKNLQHKLPVLLLSNMQHDLVNSVNMKRGYSKAK